MARARGAGAEPLPAAAFCGPSRGRPARRRRAGRGASFAARAAGRRRRRRQERRWRWRTLTRARKPGLPAAAVAGGVDGVRRRVGDRVGAHDPHPVELDLVGGHVEADQRDDHLAGGGCLVGVRGDRRRAPRRSRPGDGRRRSRTRVRPSQRPTMKPIAASSPAISRTSTKASRRRSSATWRSMNSPVSGAYWIHRQRRVVGRLDFEGQLGPARQQLLEQVGGLNGEAAERFLEPLGGALKRGHKGRFPACGPSSSPACGLAARLSAGPAALDDCGLPLVLGQPAAPVGSACPRSAGRGPCPCR